MEDLSIGDLIDNRINYLIDQIPVNIECQIIKVYSDGCVDIETGNGEQVSYVKCIGEAAVNDTAVLIFLNGDINSPFVILSDLSNYYNKKEIDKIVEDIVSGQIDLKDYVKKSDVQLKFELGDNGIITIGLDIGDGF